MDLSRRVRLPSSRIVRVFLGLVVLAALAGLFWWRRDSLTTIGSAFRAVQWDWVVVAIVLNLLSVVARALAWTTVIHSAREPPRPRVPLVFSAFSVGLFANALLPGRVGELARVAVLQRKMPGRKGAWATLVGTVFAHRVFDIVPVLLLILYVVATASIPSSARATLIFVICFGAGVVGVGRGVGSCACPWPRRPPATPGDGDRGARAGAPAPDDGQARARRH